MSWSQCSGSDHIQLYYYLRSFSVLFLRYAFYSEFFMYLSTFHAQLSTATRGLFCAHSLAPFDLNRYSIHYNHGLLNRNTNPLCQRGHFPPCTKTHLNSTSSHYASTLIEKAYIFRGSQVFLCYVFMTGPKLVLMYLKCAAMLVRDTLHRSHSKYKFYHELRYYLKIGEDQGLLFISLMLYQWICLWYAENILYLIVFFSAERSNWLHLDCHCELKVTALPCSMSMRG